jgi:RND family efflux transporter MFP subunit
LLLLVIGGAGWWWWQQQEDSISVTTAVVRAESTGVNGGRRTLLNGSGYVTARRAATVSSKVTGKVLEVLIEEGKTVDAGQILARLDGSNVEASLRVAEAQLASARVGSAEIQANLDFAEQERKRYETLTKANAASESDFRRAEAAAKALAARLQSQQSKIAEAEADVAQWKQQVDDTIIRAPFAGVVTTKNAQPGEMISPMSVGGFTRTGVCTVVDMSSLEIEVDVNESFINRVQAGQPVEATLDSYPEVKFPAKVIAIIPTADRQKATVKVRVGFTKLDPRILPEMAVKVAFQDAPEPAAVATTNKPTPKVIIPKSALQDQGGKNIVWVIQNERVERRAVTVSQTTGDAVSLSAGLAAGEIVVLKSTKPLSEGRRVTITKP